MRGNNIYIGMFSVYSLKSKFLLYYVAYHPKFSRKSMMAGHHSFFGKNLSLYFSKFLQHRVSIFGKIKFGYFFKILFAWSSL